MDAIAESFCIDRPSSQAIGGCAAAVFASLPQIRPSLFRLCTQLLIEIRQRLVFVAEVEVRQLNPARQGGRSLTVPLTLKLAPASVALTNSTSIRSAFPGAHKIAVLHVARFFQHGHRLGEAGAMMQQPTRRLRQRLQHHHARQHRKTRKVVGQIFLGQPDVFDRDDPFVGQMLDFINQVELHRSAISATRPTPRLRRFVLEYPRIASPPARSFDHPGLELDKTVPFGTMLRPHLRSQNTDVRDY